MNVTINEKIDRPLLSREEVRATISFDGPTPNRLDVRKELASAAKAKEELVIVREIDTKFGKTSAEVFAFVYKDADKMNAVESEYMMNRHKAETKEEAASEESPEASAKQPEADASEEKTEEEPETKEEKQAEPAAEAGSEEEKSEEKPAEESKEEKEVAEE